MKAIKGSAVTLMDKELCRREADNRAYMMKLQSEHLLFNYELEAGRYQGRGIRTDVMGGWESATCQLRGHFLGHWLSAAAIHYDETNDYELKAKADAIIAELAICQEENGGEWIAPIPEKYLYWIGKGKSVWAPQYNIHKLLMGLIDSYKYLHNEHALDIADHMGDWFLRWSDQYSKEKFMDILDVETGGMLEVWCDLYEITQKEKYQILIERYYRSRLFEPLLEGKDVLTNMHANTTIPEALGCAKAYEITGDEKWMEIVKAYWKCAVTDRGYFVTGGQTQGEIWTPMKKLKARLGDKNQEHCCVYNMIRLAEFLFRHTKNPEYMDYIEINMCNGIFSQTYWRGESYKNSPEKGLLTYFQPLKGGSRKDWAGEMDSFFCCHGTMVQANAALNRCIYYIDQDSILVTQFVDSKVEFEIAGKKAFIRQREDHLNGSWQVSSVNDEMQHISDISSEYDSKPDFRKYILTIHVEEKTELSLKLRIPSWISREAEVYFNDELLTRTADSSAFVTIKQLFEDMDRITVILPIGLRTVALPDDEDMIAFCYGPDVLAGICEQERVLTLYDVDPLKELSMDTERQWGDFQTYYKTENQDPGISFKKLSEIGYEPYQVYFKLRKIKR